MTADRLDTLAREAADDLHRRVAPIDTEAALVALRRTTSGRPHRVRRMVPGRRAMAAAAAAIVVVGGLTVAIGTVRGRDDQRVGTAPSVPIDPPSYGPLLGTLHGADAPGLTARVYGPRRLQDGSDVAISITGGRPGQKYVVEQSAVGDPNYNPAANCTARSPNLTIGADGAGVGVVEAWTVFDGAMTFRNDCRAVACELQVEPVIEDSQGDQGLPGTAFADQPDPARALAESPWIPITFAADAEAPPLPSITVTFLERTEQGTRVRIEGTDLVPGPTGVVVEGYLEAPTGMLTHAPGIGAAEVTRVDVPADGTLSVDVTLPDTIAETSKREVNGVLQEPRIVTCGSGTAYCVIDVGPVDRRVGPGSGSDRPALVAPPVRYPKGS